MKLIQLSSDSSQSCFALIESGFTILLDFFSSKLCKVGDTAVSKNDACGSGLLFTDFIKCPEIDAIDISTIDAILVGNVYSFIAVVHLANSSDFRASIYTTQPVYDLSKLLLDDILSGISYSNSMILQSQRNTSLFSVDKFKSFTRSEAENCLKRTTIVSFLEYHHISSDILVTAISSGYMFGCCNWIINLQNEKISYLSSSSLFKTHAIPIDKIQLKGTTHLIVSQLAGFECTKPDKVLREIFKIVEHTCKNGGNVLMPIYPSGILFDIIDYLIAYIAKDSIANVPIYCISPVIQAALSYSDISAEWLSKDRTSGIYESRTPFKHSKLIEEGKIECFESLSELNTHKLKKPCIVFASGPDLLYGPSSTLFDDWKSDSNNSCIFVDPHVRYVFDETACESFEMNVSEEYIETRLSYFQLANLIEEIRPKNVIMHAQDLEGMNAEPRMQGLGKAKVNIVGLDLFETYKTMSSEENYAEILLEEGVTNKIKLDRNLYSLDKTDVFLSFTTHSMNQQIHAECARPFYDFPCVKAPKKVFNGSAIANHLKECFGKKTKTEFTQSSVKFKTSGDHVKIMLEKGDYKIDFSENTAPERRKEIFKKFILYLNSSS